MPLAQTIIDNAFISIGLIRVGQTPATAERNDGLSTLNRIVDQWNTNRLIVPTISQASYQCSPVQSAYTIGPSGADFTAARPIMIEAAQSRQSNADGTYADPIALVGVQEYYAIPDRTAKSNVVQKLYYEPTSPTGKLYLWPTPNSTSTYLDLTTWVQMTQWPDLASTNLALYPGYERAFTMALAVEMAPRIVGANVSDLLKAEYQDAMDTIKAYNAGFPSVMKPEAMA